MHRLGTAAPTPRWSSCRSGSSYSCSASRSRRGRPRRAPTARVDLHCHSTASDGEYAPAEVVRRARAAGLAAIALTDHDTTDGVPEAERGGASADINDAYVRYLGRGRPGYVEKPLPQLGQVAALVHAVGGIVAAAHLGEHGSEGQIRQFQEQGLDGLEVRHPSHSPATERRRARIAGQLGPVVTGGSDWHGGTGLGDGPSPPGGHGLPGGWLASPRRR